MLGMGVKKMNEKMSGIYVEVDPMNRGQYV